VWSIDYIPAGGVLTDPQEAEELVNMQGLSKRNWDWFNCKEECSNNKRKVGG